MAICRNCGVEYDDELIKCPLCSGVEGKTKPVSPADVLDDSKIVNKRQLWELSMVLTLSAIIVTLAIDAVFIKGIKWSFYSSASLLYLGGVLTMIHFYRNSYLFSGVLMIATLVLLFIISLLSGNNGWYFPFALPVTVSLFILLALVLFLNSLSKYRGLNLIASIFLALSIFVIIIELCGDNYFNKSISLQWSVITAASMSIFALVLVYIHYRLKRGHNLGRLFHV